MLYGGAAFGGKTDALVIDALGPHVGAIAYERYRAVIFRDTYPNLQEVIDRTLLYYPSAVPGAVYNRSEHTWEFPGGAKVLLRHMDNVNVKHDHQGAEYQYVGWEELTLFPTPEAYEFMFSRLRCSWGSIPKLVRATTNPGNVGHAWVKQRFRIPDDGSATCFEDVQTVDGEEVRSWRRFIPAKIEDNPVAENDPDYRKKLLRMSDKDRKRLLYGRWDIHEGQFFTDWNPAVHIIDPLTNVPPHWPRWRSLDWGKARPYCVLWLLEDYDGNIHVYRELYGDGGEPNVGSGENAGQVAPRILEAEAFEKRSGIRMTGNPADPSIWIQSGIGQAETENSIGHTFWNLGVQWNRAKDTDNSRISGWDQVSMRLQNTARGRPNGLFIWRKAPGSSETVAPHLTRTLPLMIHDPKNDGDLLKDGMEDHAVDCLRYGVMKRRLAPKRPVTEPKKGRVNIRPRSAHA